MAMHKLEVSCMHGSRMSLGVPSRPPLCVCIVRALVLWQGECGARVWRRECSALDGDRFDVGLVACVLGNIPRYATPTTALLTLEPP